jgi:hypothetical protein
MTAEHAEHGIDEAAELNRAEDHWLRESRERLALVQRGRGQRVTRARRTRKAGR